MNDSRPRLLPREMIFPFVLVTFLFALWGFANDITNPMVAAFKNILLISNFESSLVQAAFYGGYCFMAIPAALFVKRFSYKSGILAGLALYASGCALFIPSGWSMAFWAFLLAYFVMTCGLSFLETSSNPYILSMGPAETATRRLNFAQAFNPMGSITGMLVAKNLILAKLNPMAEATRLELQKSDPAALAEISKHDLGVIITPYAVLGAVVFIAFVIFLLAKLPKNDVQTTNTGAGATVRRLLHSPRYLSSVLAQTFYVGVQIMVWTFIIQYAEQTLGMAKADAQFYNIIAMALFVCSRFICTFLLKYFRPGALLATLAILGGVLTLVAIFAGGNPQAGSLLTQDLAAANGAFAKFCAYLAAPSHIAGMGGLLALVGVSGCMSLMFPTIYGIALDGLGDDAKLGAAGLILAIGGGCLMPPLQGWIIDISGVRSSFLLPLCCFVVIAVYGAYIQLSRKKTPVK